MSTWEHVKGIPAVRLFSIEAHHCAATDTQKTTASMTVEVTDPQTSTALADELWPAIDEALRHYPPEQIIDATGDNQDTQIIHECLSENPIQPSDEIYRELSDRALSNC